MRKGTERPRAAWHGTRHADDDRRMAPRRVAAALREDALLDARAIPEDARAVLDDFYRVVTSSHPLTSRQRAMLPADVRALSHALTDDRESRRLGYMNQTTALGAYVHYYQWWNLVRLVRLFANLPADFFDLPARAVCADLGSGPLTVPTALLLARPELRGRPLTWYCLDVSAQAMAFGADVFLTVAARCAAEPWGIVRVKGPVGTALRQKAALVTCANTLNELAQDAGSRSDDVAKVYAGQLLSYLDRDAPRPRVLVVEPGVPQNARLISQLRDEFMRRGLSPVAPCPHAGACPMGGRRGGKWCNFAFGTEDAPRGLLRLSQEARLPKERAVLSFLALATGGAPSATQEPDGGRLLFRIASDPIRLPGRRTGFYACSAAGLLLVVCDAPLHSGELYAVPAPRAPLPVDEKSGAHVLTVRVTTEGMVGADGKRPTII